MKFLIIKRKLEHQTQFGFYHSGIHGTQIDDEWYGLELPWIDLRIIIRREAV